MPRQANVHVLLIPNPEPNLPAPLSLHTLHPRLPVTSTLGLGWFAGAGDAALHGYLQPQPPRHRRRRAVYEPMSPWSSNWGRMLRSRSYHDPKTRKGKKFRRRFRMPAVVFDRAVEEIKVSHLRSPCWGVLMGGGQSPSDVC